METVWVSSRQVVDPAPIPNVHVKAEAPPFLNKVTTPEPDADPPTPAETAKCCAVQATGMSISTTAVPLHWLEVAVERNGDKIYVVPLPVPTVDAQNAVNTAPPEDGNVASAPPLTEYFRVWLVESARM